MEGYPGPKPAAMVPKSKQVVSTPKPKLKPKPSETKSQFNMKGNGKQRNTEVVLDSRKFTNKERDDVILMVLLIGPNSELFPGCPP